MVKILTQRNRRTPKNYDGTAITTHNMGDLLSTVLAKISDVYNDRPDLLLASWPEIIGQRLAPMTQAVSFTDGVLLVKVKNSTLHSLLSQHEKAAILRRLREKFPKTNIKSVFFRLG